MGTNPAFGGKQPKENLPPPYGGGEANIELTKRKWPYDC